MGDFVLMLSDAMRGQPVSLGEQSSVLVEFTDEAELALRFDALSAGGKVVMAPHRAFWGDIFALVTDAYGIHWMFVSPPADKPAR